MMILDILWGLFVGLALATLATWGISEIWYHGRFQDDLLVALAIPLSVGGLVLQVVLESGPVDGDAEDGKSEEK